MINVRAPFRLPLGGGGTDLPSFYTKHGGFLVTSAINKYMFLDINVPALVDKIMIRYSSIEEVDNIEDIKHDIVKNTLKYFNYNSPIHINSMSDISAGTGLGSSSSYSVALIKGLVTLLRRHIPLQEIAELACKIEIDLCKKPIGKQDQYAATFGGIISLSIDQNGLVSVSPLKIHDETIKELENSLLMFYTNQTRDATIILKEQSKKVEENDSTVTNYMLKIKEISLKTKDVLEKGDIKAFGNLLHEHWVTKKKISSKMSNPQIDTWYELGLNNGAIGGKIMGAGGGGFLLFCTENGKRKYLRKVMESEGLRYLDFKFDFEGVKVLSNI